MSVICPEDLKLCPDDLCNGGGRCVRTGEQPFEKCHHCDTGILDPDAGDDDACSECQETIDDYEDGEDT